MIKKGFAIEVVLFYILSNFLFAQESVDTEKSFYKANFLSLYNKYEEALPIYLRLSDEYPNNDNLQYLTGICYLHIEGLKIRALSFLEKASQNITRHYKKDFFSETQAPPEAILYLGKAYQIDNQLNKALEEYDKYKKLFHRKQKKELVNRWIKSCELAREMMNKPGDVDIIQPELLKVGKVNYHPAVSENGKRMVFMSDTKFYHAIYFTEYKNGYWSMPLNITMEIESDGTYQVSSLNHDGTLLFLTVPLNNQSDIYVSKFEDNKWGKAIALKGSINSLHNEVFASLSPDEKQLLFVSDRSGGSGGLDIFTATKTTESKWENIKPVAPPINTPYDEQSPVLSSDGSKLFFSSNGHPTMGGFDIFVSERKNGHWQNPENLGHPPNTTDDDIYFVPEGKNGIKGFITQYLNGDDKEATIASIEFYSSLHPRPALLSGKLILPVGTKLPEDLKIQATDMAGKLPPETMTRPQEGGLFDMKLPAGTYQLSITGSRIVPISKQIVLQKDNMVTNLSIPLTWIRKEKVKKKITYTLTPVYFDFNKYSLTSEARTTLDSLVKILNLFSDIKVTVEGYTDAMGTTAYNQKLSEIRALAVKAYLVKKGISPSRLSIIGYGESHPAAINNNPDGSDNSKGRRFNRRTEFRMKGNEANQILLKQNVPPGLAIKQTH